MEIEVNNIELYDWNNYFDNTETWIKDTQSRRKQEGYILDNIQIIAPSSVGLEEVKGKVILYFK